LLDSLRDCARCVTALASRVNSAPAPLRHLSRLIDRQDSLWRSWADEPRIWFFEGVLSLELSRERGKPVLNLCAYDRVGDLLRSRMFVLSADHRWRKCV
jgi:hypothetical protein